MLKKVAFIGVLILGLCLIDAKSFVYAAEIQILDDDCYDAIAEATHVSRDDVTLYKKAFKAIREGDMAEADKLSGEIQNGVLMGHVKAEKFLSPAYTPTYDELREWLENYADHPQARKIYKMALRQGKAEGLVNPLNRFDIGQRFFSPYSWYNEDFEQTVPEHAKYLRDKVQEFRKHLNAGKTKKAKALLGDETFKKRMPHQTYDAMSATLALIYLLDNEDKQALAWASNASKRSNDLIASWTGGLASWRLKKTDAAAKYFAKLGKAKEGDEWLISAGAFWAYRAYDKLGNAAKAQ